MEYKDLIESKNSVRDYKEKEVDAATVKKIRDFAQSCERLDDSIGIDIRDRKSTRLNSSHITRSRMPSSA